MEADAEPAPSRAYPTGAEQFGMRLSRWREVRGLTLRDLAELTGNVVTKSAIARIEKGTTPPSITAARLLDEVLGAQGTLDILAGPARAEPFLHLPTGPAYFVGRQSELAQLTKLARAHPPTGAAPAVLFIGGPPGVGKTALALRWANAMQDVFDLVLYSALGGYAAGSPTSRTDIFEDLLRGLGVGSDAMPSSVPQRGSLVRDHLRRRGQRVLIVLDNARDSAQVQPLLPVLSGTTVLVTSRSQLSGLVLDFHAKAMALTTMEDADAIALASELIADERVDDEPDAVAQLIDLCGSLPLAVLVAAERVAADPGTSIREHVEALSDLGRRLYLLDIHEDDDSTGVRAAFRWSHETLPPAVARMFCLLSLHPGPRFCVRAAAALAGVGRDDGELLLDQLSQAHLVDQVSAEHFRFHDLLRVYAGEEAASLPEAERRDAQQRLARWFLHAVNASAWALTPTRDHHVRLPHPPDALAPPEFRSSDEAFRWCNGELPNILPIVRLALGHGLFFEAWRTAVELFDFFVRGRRSAVWIDTFEIAVDSARAAGKPAWLTEAQEKLAEGYLRRGDLDLAYRLDLDVAESTAALGPSRTRGFALLGLGGNAHLKADYEEARRLTREAADTFVAAGSWFGEATASTQLGDAYRALGDKDAALRHGRRALELFTGERDRHGGAIALLLLARVCHQFGDLTAALDYCGRACSAFHGTGDSWGQADALGVQGQVQADLGDPESARDSLREALVLVESHDEQKTARLLADLAALPRRP
jgi:transcriptional regulator with XRE-family HTH domain/tetratricopeptide (TPR) repeat protein